MRTTEAQSDFTGGMNDRLAPENLAPNQFASAKNMETRYGGIRSRRGSWLVQRDQLIGSGNYAEITGVGVYDSPVAGTNNSLIHSSYSPDDAETYIYRLGYPYSGVRTKMTVPEVMGGSQDIRFVQAYDYVYAMRDGGEPFRWDGEVSTSTWESVPNGTSGAMPFARDGLYAYNRLWLIEGDDTIIASDLLDANWDRINNEFRVEQGDGTRLVALRPFSNGNLIAFKERGIAVISGANNFVTTSDMTMQFIDDRIGCIAPDTAVAIGKDVFFLGREGVWTIQQTSEQNAQLVELPLSEPIWGLMQDINWQYADRFSAANYDNYYLLAVAVNGNEYPNRLLAYDLQSRSWVGYWEYDGSAYQQKDDSDRYEHARLALANNENQDSLLSVGRNGAVARLLEGDTQDMVDTYDRQVRAGYAIFPVTGGSALDLSEFTDGYIDIRGMTLTTNFDVSLIWTGQANSPNLPPWPNANNTSPLDSSNAKQTQYVWCWADISLTDPAVAFTFEVGSSTADIVEWRGTFTAPNARDFSPHDFLFYHDGTQLRVFFDEVELDVTFEAASATCLDNRSAWLDGLVHDFAVGSPRIAELQAWESVEIYTEYKTSAPHTTEVERVSYFASTVDDADTTITRNDMVDGSYSEVSVNISDGDEFSDVMSNSASVIYYATGSNVAPPTVDIESEVKTKGYSFGNLQAQKSAARGELRFEHGQPSITATMGSDKPFDTEVLASLNAKTYSLTAYDIHGKADWVQDNSNDDFATPFREDYAPIELNGAGSGVAIGSDGLVLDVYAEHTELFTSLAVFGWVQFTLANTQGFVRYNELQIEAFSRRLEQDGGNQ